MEQHSLVPEVDLLKVEEATLPVPLSPENFLPGNFLLSSLSWLLYAREGQQWALLSNRSCGDGIPSLVDP